MNTCHRGAGLLSGLTLAAGIAAVSGSSGQVRLPVMSPGESNLLYIVPKELLGTNGWTTDFPRPAEVQSGEIREEPAGKTIFYIRDFPGEPESGTKEAEFWSDWILIPVENDRSLQRLVATRVPGEPSALPPLYIDPDRYLLEALLDDPDLSAGPTPRAILMKWAEWWISETNATPVVLIMLRF